MSVPTPSEHHLTLNRLATIARLVAGAAHEVNNALQVIGGSAELLQNRTDLPVRQGPAGLLTVDVPAGAHELALAWSPPASTPSAVVALLGAALALGHAIARAFRRRRPGRPDAPSAEQPAPAVAEPVASR